MYEIDIVIGSDAFECITLIAKDMKEVVILIGIAFRSGYEVVVRKR